MVQKAKVFVWQGLNKRGVVVNGELTGFSANLVKAELRRQGVTPKKVKQKRTTMGTKKRITNYDIVVFTRQMATMLSAGIPLAQALGIVGRGHANPRMQNLIYQMKVDVESGNAFAEGLKKHPKYFDDLFCSLIQAGEQSGSLEVMLEKLAVYKEKIASIKSKVKKALYYPVAVIVVAIIITAILLMFVVPQFEMVFSNFGASLPWPTLIVIKLSTLLQSYWWLGLLAVLVGSPTFIYSYKNILSFRHLLDRVKLRIPVLGLIIQKAAIARFARTLSITYAAGLPLVDALHSVAGSTGNVVYANATEQIRRDVETGQQLQAAVRQRNVFPNMVVQMVAIGEESGSLENMLSKVANFYEEEVDNAVESLSSLLEPFIMIILGILIGSLIISMYLPIFKLGSVIR